MIPDRLAAEIGKFDPGQPVERAVHPPASWYTDAAFLRLEESTVFTQNWQCVGRADQLQEPGDYFAGSFLGNPYVVARDEGGMVRAFHNVCRHHGTRVAQGEGNRRRLVCPYHGWTYALNGRLLAAPRMDGAEGFQCDDISLMPMPVQVWGPFVFLYPGGHERDPQPLSPPLEPLHRALAETGFESLEFVSRKTYTLDCNWKVFVDNYLDGGYHVPHMHKGLAGQLDLGSYHHEIFDGFSIQRCAADSGKQQERLAGGALYAWIHPNLMINRYGPMMDVNRVIPLGERRCEVVFDYYFGAQARADQEFVVNSLAASDQVQQEDITVCQMVQEGLGSVAYQPGRYAPRLEVLAYHFHKMLVRDYLAFPE